jgi:ribosomal-protein-alanine N-acetyltransferase
MLMPATPRWKNDKVEVFLLDALHVGTPYVDWLNDPQVNRFLESRFSRHDIASTCDFVEHCRKDPNTLFWGIRAHSMGAAHIGNIKLGPIDAHHGTGDVGILLGEPASWGQGFARAAIACVVDIARHELGLRKLTAGCYASNAGSVKAFTSAGFAVEGSRPAQFLLDGQSEDLIQMGHLLR